MIVEGEVTAPVDADRSVSGEPPSESQMAASAIAFDPFARRGKWWMLSTLIASILAVVLGLLWVTWPPPNKPQPELVNSDFYLARLSELDGENERQYSDPERSRVETGIFIQTFDFETSSDVRVSGYAWQRFKGDYEESFAATLRDDARMPVVDLTTELGERGKLCGDTLPDEFAERIEALETCVRPGLVFPDMVDSRFGLRPYIIGYTPEVPSSPDAGASPPVTLPTTAPPVATTIAPAGEVEPTPAATTIPGTTIPGTTIPGTTLPAMNVATTELSAAPSTTTLSTVPDRPTLDELNADENVSAAAPGTTTIVWYFEGPIRQNLVNDDYPFDDKIIRFRMWPEDFEADAILVPDYRGYPCPGADNRPAAEGEGGTGSGWICTKANDKFGFDEAIVLDEFERPSDSYFAVTTTRYTSDFGLNRFDQVGYPDLSYNLVLERKLLNAFVSDLVPFLVAAGLAFAVLMTITGNRERSRLFSFSTTQVITTLSGLFFAVLLAHLQLRGRFDGVVYFEVFYFVMYLVLLGVAIDAVLVTAPQTRNLKVFRSGDNLIPQLLFWPTLVATIVIVTIFVRGVDSWPWSWIPGT